MSGTLRYVWVEGAREWQLRRIYAWEQLCFAWGKR